MRSSIAAVVLLVFGLGALVVRAEDSAQKEGADTEDVKISGVLIDQTCAEQIAKKEDPQKAAQKHLKECTVHCGGEAGYAIVSDGKVTKLSAGSKQKIESYLKQEDSRSAITIAGTKEDDGSIAVKEIQAKGEEQKSS